MGTVTSKGTGMNGVTVKVGSKIVQRTPMVSFLLQKVLQVLMKLPFLIPVISLKRLL